MEGASRSGTQGLAIEAAGLTKTFGSTRAVDSVDLSVERGSVYGFLGPNGAGKTTTIRILATLLRPDSGRAYVLGHDVVQDADAVRAELSLTSQFASVDVDLTVFENLVLVARLFGYRHRGAKKRASEMLEAFDLTQVSSRQVTLLSGGMRRRLDIAASLVVVPELVFLDEPTSGLDPRNRRQLWDVIRALSADGTTVLLTTQHLDEADALADRIAVIDGGAVIAEGTKAELKASVGAGAIRVGLARPEQRRAAERVLTRDLGLQVAADSDPTVLSTRIASTDGPDGLAGEAGHVLTALSRSGITVNDFSVGRPSLDEVFLAITDDAAKAPRITG